MKNALWGTAVMSLAMVFIVSSCVVPDFTTPAAKPAAVAEAKKAPVTDKKAEAPAKPVKASGDVGLLDLEKNYLILVTKEGKLITVDFDNKAKVTKIVPTPAKMDDIGLGSSVTAEYQTKGNKNMITKIEYKAAKGGE
jgi:hypothetical protein